MQIKHAAESEQPRDATMAMNLNMAGGAQGMMKEGSTLADGVDEAVLKNIGGALAASFIIFALFALASRATSTSRRWRHVSRHRRDAPRRKGKH